MSAAERLFNDGAIFVLLDFPPGSEFGIDFNFWTVGPKFMGVKMIPPGPHIIYFSSVSSAGATAPRCSFFYCFKPHQILVKKWDKQLETMLLEDLNATDQERFASNKEEMDRFLGPYPYENYKRWVSVSRHLTEPIISTLQPVNILISSAPEFESETSNSQDRLKANLERNEKEPISYAAAEAKLPKLIEIANSKVNFTSIVRNHFNAESTSKFRTENSMDKTNTLCRIFNINSCPSKESVDKILGELEFAFICFLIGNLYVGFEQWKNLVTLLSFSEKAAVDMENLYSQLISVLHYHILEIPQDFFIDIVSSKNFLVATLYELFLNLDSTDVSEELKKKARGFKNNLEKRFKYDFTLELNEYAPTIVD